MQKIIHYYAEGISLPFLTEEAAIQAEKEHKERMEYCKFNLFLALAYVSLFNF